MRPLDAVAGWDIETNAALYDRFTRDYPLYDHTSTDLALRADLAVSDTVLDLCGGTGTTAAAALRLMPEGGRVISVDSSPAMQIVGRRTHPDPRITWIQATAETVATSVSGPLDAALCNAAIWKTDTPTTFTAVRSLLRPGARFVFNVGGGFAGLNENPRKEPHRTPSLNELINLIAARDYGQPPPIETDSAPVLTAAVLRQQLQASGFTVLATEILSHQSSLEEKKAWLSIPLFSRPPGRLSHVQRLEILEKACREVDSTREIHTQWLLVVAEA